jgi:hypothetical protein
MSYPTKETIFSLIVNGHSFNKISKELNLTKRVLRRLFKEYMLPTPLAYARSLLTKGYLGKRISEGATLRDLAKEVRKSVSFITTVIGSYGLQTLEQKNAERIQELKSSDLDPSVKGALIGCLLGDSWIQYKTDSNCVFCIQHCEAQRSYAKFKAKDKMFHIFQSDEIFVPLKPSDRFFRTSQYQYSSISHPYILFLYNTAYIKGKKVVTDLLLQDLTIFGVFLWFCDDGSRESKKAGSYVFCTDGFDLESVKRLRMWLFDNMKLKSSLNKSGANYRIRIAAESKSRFEEMMKPFTEYVPNMRYKFGYDVKESSETLC